MLECYILRVQYTDQNGIESRCRRDSVTKIDGEQSCIKMAKFIVETTVKAHSPKDWKFTVETTERKLQKDFSNIFQFF